MFSDADLANWIGLPREQKFCLIERRANERHRQAEKAAGQNDESEYDVFEYMITVLAAAKDCGITDLLHFEIPRRNDEQRYEKCQDFRDVASQVSQQLMFRYGTRTYTVALDAPTKLKISHLLTQMREAVQQAPISSEKKDRLFAMIDQLQAEVDRDRTPVHAIGELYLTICTYVAEGVEKLEPVSKFLQSVGGALGIAHKKEEAQAKLPPPKETKRIETGTKQGYGAPESGGYGMPVKKKKNGCDKPLDDEIPF